MDLPITVHPANLTEQYDILSEPRLLAMLHDSPTLEELPTYLAERTHNFYLVRYGVYRMILELYPRPSMPEVYEFHVAVPKDSIIASRVLVRTSIEWSLSSGIQALVTTCPEGKMANLVRKVGCKEIKRSKGIVTFLATK